MPCWIGSGITPLAPEMGCPPASNMREKLTAKRAPSGQVEVALGMRASRIRSVAADCGRGARPTDVKRADLYVSRRAPTPHYASISLRSELFDLRDPAAAHRLVEVRVGLEQLRLRRHVGELRVEQRLLGVGDLEVDRGAFLVAQRRKIAEALQRRDVRRLNFARLAELGAVDERVLHLLEADQDGFLVTGKRLALERFGPRDLVADPAGVENRQRHVGTDCPGP